MNRYRSKAFTLIELLVVIAIIGMLSSVVLVNTRSAREKAAIAKADEDMQAILTAIMTTRLQEDKVLKDITGSGCSSCTCSADGCDYTCDACRDRMDITMKSIGLSGAIKDSWGHYYSIDENEWEYTENPCRRDTIICTGYKNISVPFYSSQCF